MFISAVLGLQVSAGGEAPPPDVIDSTYLVLYSLAQHTEVRSRIAVDAQGGKWDSHSCEN